MSLRTYALITHPAFLRHTESQLGLRSKLPQESADGLSAARPLIENIYQLAAYLEISPDIIKSCLFRPQKHYRTFFVSKRSGGERRIDAPRTFMKVIQWWILDSIAKNCPVHTAAYGFVQGRSFISNARQHIGAKHILNVDIKDFFPSVSTSHVETIFADAGYNPDVSKALAQLTTFNSMLPQGSPTSPALANIYCYQMDVRLSALADDFGLRYTRYADDITFSSTVHIPQEVLGYVADICGEYALFINGKKTRLMGINQSKEVTGLKVSDTGVSLPQHYLNRCRGYFHKAALHPQDFANRISQIRGNLSLIQSVGGRGSESVLRIGEKAIAAITAYNAANST